MTPRRRRPASAASSPSSATSTPRDRGSGGRLVVGRHPVRELLRSTQPVERVLLASRGQGQDASAELERLAAERGVPVERRDPDELEQLAPGLVHQGVVARAPAFPYARLEDALGLARDRGEPALLVALDSVTDPQNLGSIARTAEAVGAHGLLVPRRRAAGVTPSVEKAAAGALAHLPLVAVTNLVRSLTQLRSEGVWSLGLEGSASAALAGHPLLTEPCVLVVGAEGSGLARLTRERCDGLVHLPLRGRVESLNASVAAGIALYVLAEARRLG